MHATLEPTLEFQQAAQLWLDSRKFGDGKGRHRYVAPRTLDCLIDHVKMLNRFFATIPLNEIHAGHLREYQVQRSDGTIGNSGPNNINKETATLLRVMKRAHVWTPDLQECYEPLKSEEAEIARALSVEEQAHLLDVASSRTAWQLVYWYIILALHTTAGSGELRGLKLGDSSLFERMIYIRRASAKNKYRQRSIPLTDEAQWAMARILDRAHSLGAREPHHYIFPFRVVRNQFDPLRPMTETGIKTPWEEVRETAGLKWLRIHDLRHTAITRLAEAGTPLPVIMSMAGHISAKMSQHYTHVGAQAKRLALESAFGKKTAHSFPQNKMKKAAFGA